VSELAALLTPSSDVVDEYEKEYFVYRVVGVLKSIGPKASEALPALAKAKGTDRILNRAIDDAVLSITTAAPPKPQAATPTLEAVKKDLKDPDDAKRLDAVLTLGKRAAEAAEALPDLARAMKDLDFRVRDAARESAKTVFEVNRKDLPQASVAAYVSGLIGLLHDPEPWLRLQAAKDVSKLGKDAQPALAALATVVNTDPDAIVREAAKNAIDAIKGA
jgi:HEAT repeat protein